MKKTILFSLSLLLALMVSCFPQSNTMVVVHQTTGPMEANCYLLYDSSTKQAALFDVGSPIGELVSVIRKNNLTLKYIFITHAHVDHVYGVPAIKKQFPQAKLLISKAEYEDMKLYADWENTLDPKIVAEMKKAMKQNPEIAAMMNFDFNLIGKPDRFIKDNQVIKLGNLKIRAYLSPGHSRGSICFYVGDALFSGDVLFYRKVGRTDLPLSGGKDAMIKSVRRLYILLPDTTKVYPGHDQFTDIGTEKTHNEEVTMTSTNLQN
jgi:hydroxyacylglutathione hydrolase